LTFVGIAVGVVFLWLALRGVDFGAVASSFARARWALIPPFLAALFLYYWLKAMRWRLLLVPLRQMTAGRLFPPIMIGYAGSMLLPMQLGELVRAFVASRQNALPATPVLSSILLERLFDLASLLILVGLALALDSRMPTVVLTTGYALGAAGLVLMAAAGLYIAWTERVVALTRRLTGFLPTRWRTVLIDQVELGARGLDAIRRPRLLLAVSAISLAQWAAMWVCIELSLAAIALPLPWSAAFVVLASTVIGVTLPTSPGYIGSIQLAYALALQPYAIDPADAFAASLFFHVLANASVIAVGLYCLRQTGYSLARLQREASDARSTAAMNGGAADTRERP
jgi:uncharacterized membrane protein YbhN (UPF0104 family)